MVADGRQIALEIVRLTPEGLGVGYDQGLVTFVPGLLPGETAKVVIQERKARWQRGQCSELLQTSTIRQEAPCPVFNMCGGCQLQHLQYSETLLWKRCWVADALQRIGKLGVEVAPVLGMDNPWRYRNKVRLHRIAGGLLGYFREKTHEPVHFDDCLLLSERMNLWIKTTEGILRTQPDVPELRKLTFRENPIGEGLLLLETISSDGAAAPALVKALSDVFAECLPGETGEQANEGEPTGWSNGTEGSSARKTSRAGDRGIEGFSRAGEVRETASGYGTALGERSADDSFTGHGSSAGGGLSMGQGSRDEGSLSTGHGSKAEGGPARTRENASGSSIGRGRGAADGLRAVWSATRQGKLHRLWGEEYFGVDILGLRFQVSPAAFLQVNYEQTARLYLKTIEWTALSGDEEVWDLYCGIGTLTLALARQAKAVVGVEENPSAVADARRNATMNGLDNAAFYTGRVEDIISSLPGRPDVIVLDPPRAGADRRVLDRIIQLGPARVVYVSCDPGTLARDLAILHSGGYSLIKVQPVDMFPWTGHVETIVRLERKHTTIYSAP